MTTRRAGIVLAGYLVVVLALTLTPLPLSVDPPILVPFTGIASAFEAGGPLYGVLQVIANLLLLAPLGVLLPAAVPALAGSGRRVVIVALLLALGIELAQWLIVTGRQADVDDVWMNTLGAWLGCRVAGRALANRTPPA